MKTIIIESQKEFDALPVAFDEYTEIRIVGKLNKVDKTFKNAFMSVYGSATIESVSDSATIKSVSGSATIEYVYGSATIESVSDSATIKSVYATIESVSGSATIKYVYGSATIESVSGSATIKSVSGSATIESVSMNTIIRIMSNSVVILTAQQQAVLIYQNCKGCPKKKDATVQIVRTKKAKYTLENFINIYNVQKKSKGSKKIILYKFVQHDYTDFYTSKIKYEIGKTVNAPDWDKNLNVECGGGLHLSPSIEICKNFSKSNNGHALRCEVLISDIVVHPTPQYPNKIRCKKCFVVEEIIKGKP